VSRFRPVLSCVTLLALALAGAAAPGTGGTAPPSPASPGAGGIRDVYWLLLTVGGAIFVLVEGALLLFVVRYRSRGRPREVEGPQIRGHTNLEIAWTIGPVLILAVIAGLVFYKISGIENPSAAGTTGQETIRVEGHQYYWEFVYPNGAISVDTLRLPYNRKVRLEIVSADVAHSWWVPALYGKLDAIPGRTNAMKIRPNKLGTFRGQCAEFCGLLHAGMTAHVEVLPQDQYDAWIRQRASSSAALGRDTFVGVCAKCHGLAGRGGVGPAIAQSPLLSDRNALITLLRNGRNLMPPVGKTWGNGQLDATIAYLRKQFGQGGNGGG
jgi:cytochrome c oxidase subunit 2